MFEGLSVWQDEKYRKLQGTFPVISLSFALNHAHSQRFAKSSWADNQSNTISTFPPFLNKFCFVYIKIFFSLDSFKILMSDSYCSCYIFLTFPFDLLHRLFCKISEFFQTSLGLARGIRTPPTSLVPPHAISYPIISQTDFF